MNTDQSILPSASMQYWVSTTLHRTLCTLQDYQLPRPHEITTFDLSSCNGMLVVPSLILFVPAESELLRRYRPRKPKVVHPTSLSTRVSQCTADCPLPGRLQVLGFRQVSNLISQPLIVNDLYSQVSVHINSLGPPGQGVAQSDTTLVNESWSTISEQTIKLK